MDVNSRSGASKRVDAYVILKSFQFRETLFDKRNMDVIQF
jgi:hypothetical protein